MLNVESLPCRLGAFDLHGTSFTPEARDCLVVFGRSGAGNTEILDLLRGATTPECRRILLRGQDITQTLVQRQDPRGWFAGIRQLPMPRWWARRSPERGMCG